MKLLLVTLGMIGVGLACSTDVTKGPAAPVATGADETRATKGPEPGSYAYAVAAATAAPLAD